MVLVLIGAAYAGTGLKQDDLKSKAARVDSLFAPWNKSDSPGVALAVIREGSIVYQAGYGSANLEHNIAITPATIFQAASVSKQFTAFTVILLVDQKKLSLEDDVRKYLPEVPDFGKTIKIRHLIHHTSGLRDQWELLLFAGWQVDDIITQEHVMKMIRHQKQLNFDPGEDFLYTNTGYTLLAEIVERITGQTFAQWTEENIFKPLDMSNSRFYDDYESIVKNMANSYKWVEHEGFKKTILNCTNVGPTGLITTVADLAKWVGNFKNGQVGGKKVIKQMLVPSSLNNGKKISYAAGLWLGEYKGLKTVGHGGGMAGFRSMLLWFPEHDFAIALLGNQASIPPGRLAYQVAEIYLGPQMTEDEAKPAEQGKVSARPPDLANFVGTYLVRPGLTLTVSREKNRLMIQATGEDKFEMLPVSGTTFQVKEYKTNVTFQPMKPGPAALLEIYGTKAKRVKPFRPTPRQLAGYAGKYFSKELRTFYTLEVRHNRLVIRHRRFKDLLLWPTVMDQFGNDMGHEFELNAWWFRSFDFVRHPSGKVKGFRLSVGGARDIFFEKIDP